MGPADPSTADDLDALIGDIRREAARRRAAPDFPLDDEARLSTQMDQEGPTRGGADLAAVAAALRAAGPSITPAQVAELTGSAVVALGRRLTALEVEVDRGRHRRVAGATGVAGAAGAAGGVMTGREAGSADPLVEHWATEVGARAEGARPGPILIAGPEIGPWIGAIPPARGHDAYGVDTAAPEYSDTGPVRAGDLFDHLRTVADGGLALAVVVGEWTAGQATGLAALAGELDRAAQQVAVCSEAPWAWRDRLGEAAADTSRTRPIGPEAWLATLAGPEGAGSGRITARYGPTGRDFLLVATRRPT